MSLHKLGSHHEEDSSKDNLSQLKARLVRLSEKMAAEDKRTDAEKEQDAQKEAAKEEALRKEFEGKSGAEALAIVRERRRALQKKLGILFGHKEESSDPRAELMKRREALVRKIELL